MVKYFLAYAEDDGELARKIDGELCMCGLENTADGNASEEDALRAADCLFLLITSQKQTTLPEIRRRWEFFDGEMRWKRKKRGEVLLLASSDKVLAGLPLRLKKCGYYYTNEIADAAEYLEETYGAQESDGNEEKVEHDGPESKYKFPEAKEIKYAPPQEIIESPKYVAKAPGIDPFDGKPIARSGDRQSGACKEDHVFDSDFGTSDRTSPVKKGFSGVGCVIAVVALLVFIAVFSAMFAVISGNGGCSFALESTVMRVFASPFDSATGFPRFANALQTFPLVV